MTNTPGAAQPLPASIFPGSFRRIDERGSAASLQLDGCPVAGAAGRSGSAAAGRGISQATHPACVWHSPARRRLAHRPAAEARSVVSGAVEDWPGHTADPAHARNPDQQLLLPDLLSSGGYGSRIFRTVGDLVVDAAGVCRLLLLSLSGLAGI